MHPDPSKRPYVVDDNSQCATRRFRVVATFRRFNRVVGTYETYLQAARAAYRRNKVSSITVSEPPK